MEYNYLKFYQNLNLKKLKKKISGIKNKLKIKIKLVNCT